MKSKWQKWGSIKSCLMGGLNIRISPPTFLFQLLQSLFLCLQSPHPCPFWFKIYPFWISVRSHLPEVSWSVRGALHHRGEVLLTGSSSERSWQPGETELPLCTPHAFENGLSAWIFHFSVIQVPGPGGGEEGEIMEGMRCLPNFARKKNSA